MKEGNCPAGTEQLCSMRRRKNAGRRQEGGKKKGRKEKGRKKKGRKKEGRKEEEVDWCLRTVSVVVPRKKECKQEWGVCPSGHVCGTRSLLLFVLFLSCFFVDSLWILCEFFVDSLLFLNCCLLPLPTLTLVLLLPVSCCSTWAPPFFLDVFRCGRYKRDYYHNNLTGEQQWQKPGDFTKPHPMDVLRGLHLAPNVRGGWHLFV